MGSCQSAVPAPFARLSLRGAALTVKGRGYICPAPKAAGFQHSGRIDCFGRECWPSLEPSGVVLGASRETSPTLRNIVQLFFRAEGINPWAVLVCLVAASVVEGLGSASLVPLLWIVADPDNAEPSPVLDVARDIMAKLGLSLDVPTLLIFFIATLVLRSALIFVAMRHVGYAVADFSTGLRSRIIEHLFRAHWGYLVQHRVGRAASAISGQSGRAGRAYHLAAIFFAQSIQTIGYLVVAFVVSLSLRSRRSGSAASWLCS